MKTLTDLRTTLRSELETLEIAQLKASQALRAYEQEGGYTTSGISGQLFNAQLEVLRLRINTAIRIYDYICLSVGINDSQETASKAVLSLKLAGEIEVSHYLSFELRDYTFGSLWTTDYKGYNVTGDSNLELYLVDELVISNENTEKYNAKVKELNTPQLPEDYDLADISFEFDDFGVMIPVTA